MLDSTSAPVVGAALPALRGPLVQLVFYSNPDGYPPIINGVRLLARAGFDVDLFCQDNGQNWGVEYPASVRVHRLRSATGRSMRDYWQFLTRVIRMADRRAEVFVGHDMHGLLVARLLATLWRRPLVYHCHDYADKNDAKRLQTRGMRVVRDFEQRYARTANLVIVPDADRAKVMSRELRLRRAPIIVANAPLKHEVVQSKKLRDSLALHNKHFERIVFRQGSVGAGHAIEATLNSLPLWNNQKWGFVIMGSGNESYQEHLYALAKKLGVQGQFAILPPVKYDEVVQFTVGADVGHALYDPIHINHLTATTSSNKIMEYMAAEVPCIVSDRPSLRTLVEQYRCGVTANEASPESIAGAVNALLEDKKRAQSMGASARHAFENEFCYERQFAPVIKAIQNLVDRR